MRQLLNIYKAKEDYVVRKTAGEYLLVALGSDAGNKLMMLNDTGYFIWNCLQNYCSMDDLVRMVRAEYEDDTSIYGHIQEFVSLLLSKGLVEEKHIRE